VTAHNVTQHVRQAAFWFGELRRVEASTIRDELNAGRRGQYLGRYMKHALAVADATEAAIATSRASGWAAAFAAVRRRIDARIGK
jgi:hypothetical protein